MKHDDRCEAQMGYVIPRACRCEVRALEAKLWDQNELLSLLDEARKQRDDMAKAFVTQGNEYHVACDFKLAAAESRLAALRPLVRAAVFYGESPEFSGPLTLAIDRAVSELKPEDIAWAKGGE